MTNCPHQAGELVGGHKGPEGGGQGGRVQPFGSNHTRCKTSQARMPHTVGNLKKRDILNQVIAVLDFVGFCSLQLPRNGTEA